jgi:hypothetical protein
MERSRRQAVVELATALGVILLGGPVLGKLLPGRKRRAASATLARGGTPAARKPRVSPDPFAVKRHG